MLLKEFLKEVHLFDSWVDFILLAVRMLIVIVSLYLNSLLTVSGMDSTSWVTEIVQYLIKAEINRSKILVGSYANWQNPLIIALLPFLLHLETERI